MSDCGWPGGRGGRRDARRRSWNGSAPRWRSTALRSRTGAACRRRSTRRRSRTASRSTTTRFSSSGMVAGLWSSRGCAMPTARPGATTGSGPAPAISSSSRTRRSRAMRGPSSCWISRPGTQRRARGQRRARPRRAGSRASRSRARRRRRPTARATPHARAARDRPGARRAPEKPALGPANDVRGCARRVRSAPRATRCRRAGRASSRPPRRDRPRRARQRAGPRALLVAHGGKDGHPYPVDRRTYDVSIEWLREAVTRAGWGGPIGWMLSVASRASTPPDRPARGSSRYLACANALTAE